MSLWLLCHVQTFFISYLYKMCLFLLLLILSFIGNIRTQNRAEKNRWYKRSKINELKDRNFLFGFAFSRYSAQSVRRSVCYLHEFLLYIENFENQPGLPSNSNIFDYFDYWINNAYGDVPISFCFRFKSQRCYKASISIPISLCMCLIVCARIYWYDFVWLMLYLWAILMPNI